MTFKQKKKKLKFKKKRDKMKKNVFILQEIQIFPTVNAPPPLSVLAQIAQESRT